VEKLSKLGDTVTYHGPHHIQAHTTAHSETDTSAVTSTDHVIANATSHLCANGYTNRQSITIGNLESQPPPHFTSRGSSHCQAHPKEKGAPHEKTHYSIADAKSSHVTDFIANATSPEQ
jgi:hypothetical protein